MRNSKIVSVLPSNYKNSSGNKRVWRNEDGEILDTTNAINYCNISEFKENGQLLPASFLRKTTLGDYGTETYSSCEFYDQISFVNCADIFNY